MDIEELEMALERMQLPWEKILTKTDFVNELRAKFAELDRVPTVTQESAFWEASHVKEAEEYHGIKIVEVTYPWGRETRYGIQGMPGLWGREAVEAIREAEEW